MAVVKLSINSKNKVVTSQVKTSHKIESPFVCVANCVSSLLFQTGMLWLKTFKNSGNWSAESISDVSKLLYKLSPLTKIWSKSDLP